MATDWSALADAVRAVPAEVGFWVRRLDTSEEWAADADRLFPAASTIKVPILVQLFRRVEAGEVRLDDRLELTDERKAVGSGVLKELDAGLRPTIKDLATLMIVVSDNTATNLCIDAAGGLDAVNAAVRDLGLAQTRLRRYVVGRAADSADGENATTARELGTLLELIWRGRAARPESCRQMLAILAKQQLRQRLPRLYPEAIQHHGKTGSIGHAEQDWFVRHDCSLGVAPGGLVFAAACLTRTRHGEDGDAVDRAVAAAGLGLLEALGIARSGKGA